MTFKIFNNWPCFVIDPQNSKRECPGSPLLVLTLILQLPDHGGSSGIAEGWLGGSGKVTPIPRGVWAAFTYQQKYFNNNQPFQCVPGEQQPCVRIRLLFFFPLSAVLFHMDSVLRQSLSPGCEMAASGSQGCVLPPSHSAKRGEALSPSSPSVNPEICSDGAG